MTPATLRQLAALEAPEPESTHLVPAAITPWTPEQVAQALTLAWPGAFGTHTPPRSLAILLAQWALETGWGKSCWGSNLGNARPPWPRGDTLCLQIPGGKVSEVLEGTEYFFSPPSVGSTFRAFSSLDAGADWYINSLFTRFEHAWPAVIAGDPTAYAQALHESHYYTADVAVYTATMVSLFRYFMQLEPIAPTIPEELVSAARKAQLDEWLAALEPELTTPAQELNAEGAAT